MKKTKNINWKIQPRMLSWGTNGCATRGSINGNHSMKNCKERVINFEDFPSTFNFDVNFRSFSGAAGFSGFARPKTALPPETERSLTSEFGTGSGGSRALWPATRNITSIFGAYKHDGENFVFSLICFLLPKKHLLWRK